MSSTAKESKDPSLRKKRRTVVKTESRSSSPDSSSKKSKSHSDYSKQNARNIFFYEENEAQQTVMQEDVATHKAACRELERIMMQIKQLKESGKDNVQVEIEELKVQGALQFVILKKMNRMAHFKCKKVRDQTHDAKQQIDQHHLQLQNLLYEVMHLQKEITKCMEFKSKDEDINLVSPEEFYNEAPENISKPDVTKKDLHQQTLARLDWELEQRKQLSEKLKEVKTKKGEILKETKNKKSYLDSLQPKLNSILQATKPVQEYLDMPFDEIREQHKTATYLPRPLYVLYMQASAYRDACDKYLAVNIQGDVDVAKAIGDTKADIDDESESDTEEQEKATDQKRRHRTNRTGKEKVSKLDKILKKHPLCVQLHIQCKDGSILYLTFDYLLVLEIVTVTVKLVTSHDTNVTSTGDLLSSDSLLACLYPEDFGNDTPNSSNKYAFQKASLGPFSQHLSKVGRPYHWVQWLCGLQFLNQSEKAQKSESQFSASHIEATIKRLRRRVKARVSLGKQLSCLEKCMVAVAAEYHNLYPVKLCSKLTSWKRITYEDFCSTSYTQHIVQTGLARDTDLYFTGVIERGSAKMSVQVLLVPEYPEEPPVFAINVQWKSQQKNSTNSEDIRDMEAELNIHYAELMKEKSHDQLLTNQIQRLLMCFDVYLETLSEATPDGPCEFAKEKIFTRTARGPLRSKPYVFNGQLGFFMQR